MIFSFFIIAVFVFILFRILNFVLGRLKTALKFNYPFKNIVSVIELVTWIAFVLWVVKAIYDSTNYFVLISISIDFLLLVVLFFFLIRDFVFGIFLKLQYKITEGNYIDIEDIKGIVNKAGHFRLDIEDSNKNICSVSYYKVRSKIITKSGPNQNLEKVTIEFHFQETVKINELIAQLKKEVMNTPWVAISQPPIIENINTEKDKLIVKVGVFVLDKSYAENIKTSVLSYLSSI